MFLVLNKVKNFFNNLKKERESELANYVKESKKNIDKHIVIEQPAYVADLENNYPSAKTVCRINPNISILRINQSPRSEYNKYKIFDNFNSQKAIVDSEKEVGTYDSINFKANKVLSLLAGVPTAIYAGTVVASSIACPPLFLAGVGLATGVGLKSFANSFVKSGSILGDIYRQFKYKFGKEEKVENINNIKEEYNKNKNDYNNEIDKKIDKITNLQDTLSNLDFLISLQLNNIRNHPDFIENILKKYPEFLNIPNIIITNNEKFINDLDNFINIPVKNDNIKKSLINLNVEIIKSIIKTNKSSKKCIEYKNAYDENIKELDSINKAQNDLIQFKNESNSTVEIITNQLMSDLEYLAKNFDDWKNDHNTELTNVQKEINTLTSEIKTGKNNDETIKDFNISIKKLKDLQLQENIKNLDLSNKLNLLKMNISSNKDDACKEFFKNIIPTMINNNQLLKDVNLSLSDEDLSLSDEDIQELMNLLNDKKNLIDKLNSIIKNKVDIINNKLTQVKTELETDNVNKRKDYDTNFDSFKKATSDFYKNLDQSIVKIKEDLNDAISKSKQELEDYAKNNKSKIEQLNKIESLNLEDYQL